MSGPASGLPGQPVDLTDLVVLRELGGGGQGTVRLVDLPGRLPAPMAYKEYTPASLAEVDVEGLARLVTFPAGAEDRLRRLLSQHTAWPAALVRRGSTVCGFLMPAAGPEFLTRLRLPTGDRSQPLAMELLLNPPEYLARVHLPITDRTRVSLLYALATLLRRLHRYGVVVGDLSPRNILVSRRPPRCFLLDCDAMRVHGRSALPQVETPDWRLPPGEELATGASDRFKFGLLAIRLLTSDQSASDPELLRPAQPALAELARRSRRDPDARPGWEEWLPALEAAVPAAPATVPAAARPPGGTVPPPGAVLPTGTVTPHAGFPPRSGPAGRRRTALAALALGGLVAFVCILLAIGGFTASDTTGSSEDGTSGGGFADGGVTDADGDSGGGGPGRVEPDRVGIVALRSADHPESVPVAEFFDSYFRSVNDRDWDAVLAMYDPDGVVDSTDSTQRESFRDAMATTEDDDITLAGVRLRGDRVLADVSFRSTQAAGHGPPEDADQTCTRWDITFVLTRDGGDYRILEPERASHRGC